MNYLSLGFSPCPNDTHIFYGLVHGCVERNGLRFRERLEDVETLNRLALEGCLDVSKVSCHALGFVRDQYCVLRAGGALGRGCGPLVVTRDVTGMDELRGKRVAFPGRFTTASLLFRLLDCEIKEAVFLPFYGIMEAVRSGEVDAGVIIHESRFTFESYGLKKLVDLGSWWEKKTGCPVPLGCIVARRSLGERVLTSLELLLHDSIVYANGHPDDVKGYVRRHSREMTDEVCAAHINLYVNEYSLELGREGEGALEELLAMAESRGLVPESSKKLFVKQS